MFRLYILNATHVRILIGELSQPRASFCVFASNWANPCMILVIGVFSWSDHNPRQNVMPPLFPPSFDVHRMKSSVIRFEEAQTTISTLLTMKSF